MKTLSLHFNKFKKKKKKKNNQVHQCYACIEDINKFINLYGDKINQNELSELKGILKQIS